MTTDQTPAAPQTPASAPATAQDAPGGPGRQPDAQGAPQAALQRLHRLRGQLAVEQAKVVRADQHPRPDLDHLRVTPHNGMAAGLEIAIFFADHHLREADEEARTTPDNPATGSDAADNPLREQIQAAIEDDIYEYRERHMFWEEGGVTTEIARLATRGAMEVRDREMEQLRARIVTLEHVAAGNKRHVQLIVPDLERAAATVERVRSECDRLEAAVRANPTSPDFDGAYLAAIRHIRAALQPAATEEPGEQP